MAKLSKTELAALDLIIAKKREDASFIGDILNVVQQVAQATPVVAQVTQVATALAGGVVASGGTAAHLAGKKDISLEELLEIRKKAEHQ